MLKEAFKLILGKEESLEIENRKKESKIEEERLEIQNRKVESDIEEKEIKIETGNKQEEGLENKKVEYEGIETEGMNKNNIIWILLNFLKCQVMKIGYKRNL